MTNEIKEILFLLHNDRLTDSGKRKLEDYITNLQNENMKYDQCLTELTDNYKDLQKKITNLQEENEHLKMQVECLLSKDKPKDKMIEKLALENERLNRKIQIKNNWADLLIGIGYDYDGYNKVESLKALIDELVDYAYKIKENDETTIIYENNGKTYNILDEEIKGEDNE